MNIIYEDNHLLVVEKLINVVVQADKTNDIDLLTKLKTYLKDKYNKPGNVYLGLVHRLDRPVGGIMVFAKTSKCASRLSEQIRTNTFKKQYLAVVKGSINKKYDTLENYLYKNEKNNMVSVVKPTVEGAKKAILDYELIESNNKLSLLKINLHTGRPHQIRVQLANIHFPIYGDQRYNKDSIIGQQIALWSNSIQFKHPITKEYVKFECNPPKNQKPWNEFKIIM